jgi:hypothetical protein
LLADPIRRRVRALVDEGILVGPLTFFGVGRPCAKPKESPVPCPVAADRQGDSAPCARVVGSAFLYRRGT